LVPPGAGIEKEAGEQYYFPWCAENKNIRLEKPGKVEKLIASY
jgi:hypothetical protein